MTNENLKLILILIIGIIEIILRLVPTKKDYSIISNFSAFLDFLIPNYGKKDDDEPKPPLNQNFAL